MEDRTSTEPGVIDNSDVDEGDKDVEGFEGGVMMARHFYLNEYARRW